MEMDEEKIYFGKQISFR
ncbi:Protein of unknown function [Bacillus mycoides]|nr:Protein of unknown function [Bacillus mycoides]